MSWTDRRAEARGRQLATVAATAARSIEPAVFVAGAVVGALAALALAALVVAALSAPRTA